MEAFKPVVLCWRPPNPALKRTRRERRRALQASRRRAPYLVSCYTFDTAWAVWEMHPKGDEIIFLLSGSATFHLETNGETRSIELKESGTCLVVPKGTWHTAEAKVACRMLFITPGEGTTHRETSA